MSLLLTHGYFLDEDPKEKEIMKPYPPLGLLYISSYLLQKGLQHEVFDSTFSNFKVLTDLLDNKKFRQVAIYTNLMTKLNVLRLISYIRNSPHLKDTWIILGGPDVRHNAAQYIGAGADIIVIGEGEETMADLVSTLNVPMNPFLDQVAGIAFKNYFGDVVFTAERAKIREVDQIPFPNRAAIPVREYMNVWKKHHGKSALNISTQRGCPYTCRWCSTAVYGQSYRRRSASNVCDEIEQLIRDYHPDTLWFVDDVFTVSHRWLKEFADQVNHRNIRIQFECITRADRLSDEALHDLKRAGCYRVWIGAESGSQDVIDKMDRRVKVEQVREMLQKARQIGIETGTFIMLGYPGETEQDIVETVEHLVQSNPHYFTITIAYPIRGTGLYEEVKPSLVNSPDWFASTDRDLDFKRRYPREYYNYAVRFVVNEVKYRTLPVWKRWLTPRGWMYRLKSVAAQDGMQRNKIHK